MEKGLRRFVRTILLVHLALLALLLAVVAGAARHIYASARAQAIRQAQERQSLLAYQTARGVGAYYDSILSDLDLLKPDEQDESDLPETPLTPDAQPLMGLGTLRGAVTAKMLVTQLQGRALLFWVDEHLHPHTLGDEVMPKLKIAPGQDARAARMQWLRSSPSTPFEESIIARMGSWLKTVKKPAISDFTLVEQGGVQHGLKLICEPLPAPARKSTLLVAAVSARPIEQRYFAGLNQHGASGAFLVDDTMTIVAASEHEQIGLNVNEARDPMLHSGLGTFAAQGYAGNVVLDRPFGIGTQSFGAAMVSAQPVTVMGRRWFVLVVSPLADVDGIVREFAGRAIFWAIFVALSMAAILVSTAAQLIRSRMRMERVRHELLQNELRQARQIQLAWLPQKTKATCSSVLDIASLNRPASHISGDFYNFFELPDGRTALVIGDVTGHGTAAAFLMATTQLLVRNTLPNLGDPGRCLEEVNRQLTNQVFNGQFVTMQVVVIDALTGDARIATAGHPPPLIGDGGAFRSLKIEPQLVLGVDAASKYPTENFRIRPGGFVLLYTDGVTETENSSGGRLRVEGLRNALGSGIESAESLLQTVLSAVNTFRGRRELGDDLTLLAVRFDPMLARPPAQQKHLLHS